MTQLKQMLSAVEGAGVWGGGGDVWRWGGGGGSGGAWAPEYIIR